MSRKYFCDENCNECELISCDNYRQLTLILNALHQKFGEGVYKIVQHFCPNLTACADCRIDDFCHCEECELLNAAENYVSEKTKKPIDRF